MGYRERCYNSFVSKHWQHHFDLSEDQFKFISKIYSKRFPPFLPKDKDASILDVACGTGYFLYFLRDAGYTNYSGIDISDEQIEVAKQIGIDGIKKADAMEFLPEHKDSYDLIVAMDIIEHLGKDEILEFLDLIYDALKPGGKVLIGTVNAASLLGSKIVFVDFTHETGFTPESLAQAIRVCDFDDVEIHGEEPVIHDLRSAIRAVLWKAMKFIIKGYIAIETGMGRGGTSRKAILEPKIFAVARKKL